MKRIVWTDPAKNDVRSLSKPVAMQVLYALHRFVESGAGDARALEGKDELRLRVGDYRLVFICPDRDTIEIRRVRHRRSLPMSRAVAPIRKGRERMGRARPATAPQDLTWKRKDGPAPFRRGMTNAELEDVRCVNTFAHSGTRWARNPRVWRYMDLLSLISLLHRGELHFTRLSDLLKYDPNEGTGAFLTNVVNSPITPSVISYPTDQAQEARNQEEIRRIEEELCIPLAESLPRIKEQVGKWDRENRNVHISCWHTNEIESDFMWKVYARQEYGFAIVSTAQAVVKALVVDDVSAAKIGWGFVVYPTRDQLIRERLDIELGSTAAFMMKHLEFSPENEFRVFVRAKKCVDTCEMKVRLSDLIHEIRLSPFVPEWAEGPLVQTLTPICEQKGLSLVRPKRIRLRG